MLRRIIRIVGPTMARKGKQIHPGRILREEYMEPMRLDTSGLAAALGVTEGRLAVNTAIAPARSSAITTSYSDASAHFICVRMSSSSSTMSSVGFVICRR